MHGQVNETDVFVIGYTDDNNNQNNDTNHSITCDYYPVDIPMYLTFELGVPGQDQCFMYVLHEMEDI